MKRIGIFALSLALMIGLYDCVKYTDEVKRPIYDYIVVGAGTAGSVVANRLSEDGQHTVLLLEAGGKPPQLSEVPIFAPLHLTTKKAWVNFMEQQENACQGHPGGRCILRPYKALGGCSSHNYMSWVRGNKNDYDNWERMGAQGWNYKNLLETFKSTENFTDEKILKNGYHGDSGYQTVSALRYKTEAGNAFIEAVKSLGYEFLDDYNAENQRGIAYLQVAQRDGLRCSTEKAFLRPAAGRPNLDIVTFAYVRTVIFDDQQRITGVWYHHNRQTKRVLARKEIVLSAGALSTPVILMHSGIGPREHLEEHKIPVLVDLPGVGQNLHDHLFFSHLNYVVNKSIGIVPKRDVNAETIADLLVGKGPLTSPALLEVVAFIDSGYENKSEGWPDIQLFGGSGALADSSLSGVDFSDKNSTGVLYAILRPKSRGFLKLGSADPHDDPIINPRFFSHPEDIKRVVYSTRKVMSIYESPAMKRYNPVLTPKILKGCEHLNPDSDEYIECATRHYVIGGFHLAGTCRMGNPKDNTTVVDPQLRVKGVSGLRIADASIMPQIVSGNPNAACIMIGRKAADMILGSP